MTSTTVAPDIAGRRAAAIANPTAIPSTSARDPKFPATLRAQTVSRDGKSFYRLEGIASVVETWYPMFDFYGEYEEMVAAGAFDRTLAENPDVVFLLNHRGMTMARTRANTLELDLDESGSLRSVAYLNPERQDVKDLVLAVDDENITEMSFAFRIRRGQWNPDYTTYTILEVDIDRGDVSAVNYGANPFTSIAARTQQVIDGIDHLEGVPLQAAYARIQARIQAERGAADAAPAEQDPTPAPAADDSALIAALQHSLVD